MYKICRLLYNFAAASVVDILITKQKRLTLKGQFQVSATIQLFWAFLMEHFINFVALNIINNLIILAIKDIN